MRRNRKPLDHLLIFISIVAIWMWAHTKIHAHVVFTFDDVPILRSVVPPVLCQCKCECTPLAHCLATTKLPKSKSNMNEKHNFFEWTHRHHSAFDSLISTHCTSDYDRKIENHWENWCACHRRLMVMTTKTALSSCRLVDVLSWCRRHSRTMYFNSVA